VSIANVLHLRMYDRRLGWGDYARGLYRAMPEEKRWSDVCIDCDRCAEACPYGVDAPARIRDAHRRLG
jgi:Fe-S oxidoreductase